MRNRAPDEFWPRPPAAIVISQRLIIVSRLRQATDKITTGLRMLFAMGMLVGASLGCTFGFVLSGILRSGKPADLMEPKYRSAYMDRDCP